MKICDRQLHDADENLAFFRLNDDKLKLFVDEKIVKAQKLFDES